MPVIFKKKKRSMSGDLLGTSASRRPLNTKYSVSVAINDSTSQQHNSLVELNKVTEINTRDFLEKEMVTA